MTVPMEQDEAYIVTVGHRHTRRMFYCFVNEAGTHWTFVDSDHREYQGPPFTPIDHEFQLHHLVSDWWADQCDWAATYSMPSPSA